MAEVTSTVASFSGDLVQVQAVWDDVTRAIKRIQVVNGSKQPCAWGIRKANVLVREQVVAGEQTRGRNLPKGLNYQWVLDEGDDVDGNPLGWGLSLGDIEIHCRWPA